MSRVNYDIRIGTSGWHYEDWKQRFYPGNLPKNKWLEHYSKHFDTVEINNTFYHQPKQQTFKNWYRQGPENFLYTVKANRYITHIKRLEDTSEALGRFFEGTDLLKEKLGPILYQLPPSLHKDLDRLTEFLKLLSKNQTSVFEFRHKSWFAEDVFELLDKSGVGFCIHDMSGVSAPRVITGRLIYIRFHGPTGKYEGNYSTPTLKKWAKWIKEHTKEARSAYAYFNNDINANAVNNAKTLKKQLINQ